jgi:hypothetical protein
VGCRTKHFKSVLHILQSTDIFGIVQGKLRRTLGGLVVAVDSGTTNVVSLFCMDR